MSRSPVTRRDFLLTAAVLAACAGEEMSPTGTGGNGGSGGDAGGGSGGEAGSASDAGTETRFPFGIWEEARDAVRTSPDHLIAESERLVAEADPAKLFEFVRDRIVTLPATATSLGGETLRLFGVRGTLRSGSGTMRDKADLLAQLYADAGLMAEVVSVSAPADVDFVKKAVMRSAARVFDPDVTEEQAAGWLERLGMTARTSGVIDTAGTDAQALADALVAQLPMTVNGNAFDFSKPISIPVVSVMVGGTQRLANPATPDLEFGDSGSSGNPRAASDATALPTVRATLSIVNSSAPTVPVELVSAEFKTEDLIGRSLYVMMVPPEDIAESINKDLDAFRTFVPALSLQAPGLEAAAIEANTHVGSALARTGDVYAIQPDGTLNVNGTELDTSPYDAAKTATVDAIELSITASNFTRVSIRLAALDGSGNSVPGLSAASFEVREDDAAQPFVLVENQSPPPRVLFLLDKSTSLPPEFQSTAAAALVKDMATSVLGDYPGASFRVHVVGGRPEDGVWTADPTVLETAALNQSGIGSDLWGALGEAAKLGGTVIVFVTDGSATDTPGPEELSAISIAPPSVFLLVGTGATTTLDEMALRTGGSVVAVADQAAARAQTQTFIAARQKSAYLLKYDAPESGPATRSVKVTMTAGSATQTETYAVPAAPEPPNRIGGILLTLESGSQTVTRALAGRRELTDGTPDSVFEEVRDAFLGTFEVRFEGGAPTMAHVLDEMLTARLALEPFWDASRGTDNEAILDALVKTPPMPSGAAYALHGPLQNGSAATVFPTGLRAAIHVAQPLGRDAIARRIDLVPLHPYAATSSDRRVSLRETAAATARYAVIEASLFPTSTREQLAGETLVHVPPFTGVDSVITGLSPELVARWRIAMQGYTDSHRLVPASGAPVAFWRFDSATGELLGVLERGTGGAEDIQQYETSMNNLIDLANRLGTLGGMTGVIGTAGGVWLSLELTKAKKLLGAIVVLSGGTPSDDPTNWNDAGCGLAAAGASAAADSVGGLAKIISDIIGQADSLATLATGDGILC